MTIQDVKQIKLADYLQSLGYTPVKQQGRNLWYKSPLREETDASFKVNTELEKWYDFGIGKGGNIIALAAELYRSEDVAYLLKRIEEQTAYIRPASFSFGRQHSDNQPYQGLRVGELSSPQRGFDKKPMIPVSGSLTGIFVFRGRTNTTPCGSPSAGNSVA